MNLAKKEIKTSQVKIKSTSQLSLSIFNENNPVARVERRLQAFIANSDWIYDTLNLIEKALTDRTNLSTYDNWTLERLDLTAGIENNQLILTDRYHAVLTRDMLTKLKNSIVAMTLTYARKVLKKPELHHMEKMFIRTLRKSATRKLTAEETNVLKEAYLKVEDGKVVNLKGEVMTVPKFNFLRLLLA